MIDLPVKKLEPGMTLAQSVYNTNGVNYLTRGTQLTYKYIERLRQLGVGNIHVMSTAHDVPLRLPEDVLSERTRAAAVKRVYDAFQQVMTNGTFDMPPIAQAAAAIINDIMKRRGNLVQLTDIRIHDMYTFVHCVNVAMLSTMIGVLDGMRGRELSMLCIGALLHDLGKLVVPAAILNKPGRLTDEEFAIVKKHPQAGADRILSMGLPDGEMLAVVAQQHHEHMDGTGYPGHREGKQIHKFGRMCAIADVYDALTSERPYKKAYTPSIAYNIMKHCSPGQFDEHLLQLFFRNVAIYPVGTVLKTSVGHAIVKKAEFGHTERPDVVLFSDLNGHMLDAATHIRLTDRPEVKIEGVVNDQELYHFIHVLGKDPAVFLTEESETT